MIRLSLARSTSRRSSLEASRRSSCSRPCPSSCGRIHARGVATSTNPASYIEGRVQQQHKPQPLLRKPQRSPASSTAHHRAHRPSPPRPQPSPALLRAEETQEILRKFFRNRQPVGVGVGGADAARGPQSAPPPSSAVDPRRSDGDLQPRQQQQQRAPPPPPPPPRPSPDVSNQYFSKLRPFLATPDVASSSIPAHSPSHQAPTRPPPPSLSASKLSHLLKSSIANHHRVVEDDGPPGDRPMDRSATGRGLGAPADRWGERPLPPPSQNGASRRPQAQSAQMHMSEREPRRIPTTISKSDPTDVSALRAALLGEKMPTTASHPLDRTRSASGGSPAAGAGAGAAEAPPVRKRSSFVAMQQPRGAEAKVKDFDASLSEFIRRVQADQAKRAAAEQAIRDSAAASAAVASVLDLATTPGRGAATAAAAGPNPTQPSAWRSTVGRMHMDLRSHRNHQRYQREALERSAALAWGQQSSGNSRKRPSFVDPKKKAVVLPPYPVSLAEASLLLRERMTRVRRLLRDVLGYQRASSILNSPGGADVMIEPDVMELLALELDRPFEKVEASASKAVDEPLLVRRAEAAAASAAMDPKLDEAWASLPSRPPVVCLLGHVDHGKTTLMDTLRRRSQQIRSGGASSASQSKGSGKSKPSISVAGTEAGGITQMISAFQVPLTTSDGKQQEAASAVTFLDTPGHAAFKAMRQSGSDAADIIVLVVAADDGVSAQTVEILNFYKSIVKGAGSGGISLVVAMNKIDKPGIDVEESRRRIESQLLEHGILVEGMPYSDEGEFGPPVQLIPVSGLTGEGIDELIEGLMIQAEVMDLRADDSTSAEGIVMDARVDKGLGNVVDCIIRWGSLSKGDVVVSGTSKGCVRFLKDMNDKPCAKGLPSQPVRIIGFDTLPKAGEPLICLESEEAADELISRRMASVSNEIDGSISAGDAELQSAGKHMMHGTWKDKLEVKHGLDEDEDNTGIRIPVVVKADADGSLAAIREALLEIGQQSKHNVAIELVKSGVGPLLANEIQLAKEAGAAIVCFNVKNEQAIVRMAEDEQVALLGSKVIYTLLDLAKEEFANYLPTQELEIVHGRAEVQATYEIGGMSETVAGLRVSDGKLYRAKTESKVDCQFRVLRGGKIISQTDLRATSLKHFKEDVNEIGRGKECGLSLAGYNDYQAGDVIECYSVELKKEFA